jgi:hypothetical protein
MSSTRYLNGCMKLSQSRLWKFDIIWCGLILRSLFRWSYSEKLLSRAKMTSSGIRNCDCDKLFDRVGYEWRVIMRGRWTQVDLWMMILINFVFRNTKLLNIASCHTRWGKNRRCVIIWTLFQFRAFVIVTVRSFPKEHFRRRHFNKIMKSWNHEIMKSWNHSFCRTKEICCQFKSSHLSFSYNIMFNHKNQHQHQHQHTCDHTSDVRIICS